jgi:hypothetical protein
LHVLRGGYLRSPLVPAAIAAAASLHRASPQKPVESLAKFARDATTKRVLSAAVPPEPGRLTPSKRGLIPTAERKRTMNAQQALEQLDALRELTAKTGVQTKRTQNTLLASLTADVLVEVAVTLRQREAVGKILSGTNEQRGTDVNNSGAR